MSYRIPRKKRVLHFLVLFGRLVFWLENRKRVLSWNQLVAWNFFVRKWTVDEFFLEIFVVINWVRFLIRFFLLLNLISSKFGRNCLMNLLFFWVLYCLGKVILKLIIIARFFDLFLFLFLNCAEWLLPYFTLKCFRLSFKTVKRKISLVSGKTLI